MAKAVVEQSYGDVWPFEDNKPDVEQLYTEVVEEGKYENVDDTDVCFILLALFYLTHPS